MPLIHGFSSKAISANIEELIKSGRKPRQAKAIAEAEARKAKRQQLADGGLAKTEPLKHKGLAEALVKAGLVQHMDAGGSAGYQFFNPQDTYQAQDPSIQQANWQGQMAQAQQLGQQANQGQAALAQQLQAQANGQGPSLAQMQLQQATQGNIQNAASQAASARGLNPALAQREAMQNVAQANQGAAGQAAMTRLMEQRQAQEQLANVLGEQRQAAGQMYGQNVMGYGQQNQATTAGQLGVQEINAKIANENTQGDRGLLAGILGGIGSNAAEGGEIGEIKKKAPVLHFDDGGGAPDFDDGGGAPVDASALTNQATLGSLSGDTDAAPAGSSLRLDYDPQNLGAGPSIVGGSPDVQEDQALIDEMTSPDAGYQSGLAPQLAAPDAAHVQQLTPATGTQAEAQASAQNGKGIQVKDWLPLITKLLMGGAMLAARAKGPYIPTNHAKGGPVFKPMDDGGYPDEVAQVDQAMGGDGKDSTGGALGTIASIIEMVDKGGRVPGKPIVPGDHLINDRVPAMLSPGEIVLPRSVTKGPAPEERAAGFVKGVESSRSHPIPAKPTFADLQRLEARLNGAKMAGGGDPPPDWLEAMHGKGPDYDPALNDSEQKAFSIYQATHPVQAPVLQPQAQPTAPAGTSARVVREVQPGTTSTVGIDTGSQSLSADASTGALYNLRRAQDIHSEALQDLQQHLDAPALLKAKQTSQMLQAAQVRAAKTQGEWNVANLPSVQGSSGTPQRDPAALMQALAGSQRQQQPSLADVLMAGRTKRAMAGGGPVYMATAGEVFDPDAPQESRQDVADWMESHDSLSPVASLASLMTKGRGPTGSAPELVPLAPLVQSGQSAPATSPSGEDAPGITTDPDDFMRAIRKQAIPINLANAGPQEDQGNVEVSTEPAQGADLAREQALEVPSAVKQAVAQRYGIQAPAPQAAPSAEPDEMAEAIRAKYGLQAQGMAGQLAAMRAGEEQRQALQAQFQDTMKRRSQQMDELEEDIKNSKVNPNNLWENKSTAQRVASSIGIMIGGYAQGLGRYNSNPVLDQINRQVSLDIDAQKANLSNKFSLYNHYLERTGSDLAAENFAKADLLQGTMTQMQMAAMQTGNEQARVGAMQDLANLQQQRNMLQYQGALAAANLKVKQTEASAKQTEAAGGYTKNVAEAGKLASETYGPDINLGGPAVDPRNGVPIPGTQGFEPRKLLDKSTAGDVSKKNMALIASQQSLAHLMEIYDRNKHGAILPSADVQAAESEVGALKEYLAQGMTGTMPRSGKEAYGVIDSMVKNPTDFMQWGTKAKASLDTIQQIIAREQNNLKQTSTRPANAPMGS